MTETKAATSSINQVTATPKERFQQSGYMSYVRDLLTRHEFHVTSYTALAEYQHQLALRVGDDGNSAAAMGLKLKGAIEFLKEFKNLAVIPAQAPRQVRTDNLNQNS